MHHSLVASRASDVECWHPLPSSRARIACFQILVAFLYAASPSYALAMPVLGAVLGAACLAGVYALDKMEERRGEEFKSTSMM